MDRDSGRCCARANERASVKLATNLSERLMPRACAPASTCSRSLQYRVQAQDDARVGPIILVARTRPRPCCRSKPSGGGSSSRSRSRSSRRRCVWYATLCPDSRASPNTHTEEPRERKDARAHTRHSHAQEGSLSLSIRPMHRFLVARARHWALKQPDWRLPLFALVHVLDNAAKSPPPPLAFARLQVNCSTMVRSANR